MIMHNERMEDEDRWPVRPILLAIVGALACLAVQQIGDGGSLSAAQRALMAAVATGALAFGFTAERVRLGWSMIFAAVVAVVTELVFWWSGAPDGGVWRSEEDTSELPSIMRISYAVFCLQKQKHNN